MSDGLNTKQMIPVLLMAVFGVISILIARGIGYDEGKRACLAASRSDAPTDGCVASMWVTGGGMAFVCRDGKPVELETKPAPSASPSPLEGKPAHAKAHPIANSEPAKHEDECVEISGNGHMTVPCSVKDCKQRSEWTGDCGTPAHAKTAPERAVREIKSYDGIVAPAAITSDMMVGICDENGHHCHYYINGYDCDGEVGTCKPVNGGSEVAPKQKPGLSHP